MSRACGYIGISRQAYYQRHRCERERAQCQDKVIDLVKHVRMQQPRLGTRKLHYMLKSPMTERGLKVGRDGLFDILRTAHMLVVPRRAYHKTTNSNHRFRRHPNLLKAGPQQIVPTGPEQVWVADITYLPTTDPS